MASQMICDCGKRMNHHADMLDYSTALEETGAMDLIFGAAIEEIHLCPGCGRIAARHVEEHVRLRTRA
jgi:hypothetical protein